MTQRRTECRRCERPYGEHDIVHPHAERQCPDGSGRTFQKRENSNLAQSFTDAEIEIAERLTKLALTQSQFTPLVRHKGFAGLARKFQSMHKRAVGRKHSLSKES